MFHGLTHNDFSVTVGLTGPDTYNFQTHTDTETLLIHTIYPEILHGVTGRRGVGV